MPGPSLTIYACMQWTPFSMTVQLSRAGHVFSGTSIDSLFSGSQVLKHSPSFQMGQSGGQCCWKEHFSFPSCRSPWRALKARAFTRNSYNYSEFFGQHE